MLHDIGSIYRYILDIPLDVLLFISEEIIDVSGPSDIVLAHQTAKGFSHLFPQGDLVGTDIICHEDHNTFCIIRN